MVGRVDTFVEGRYDRPFRVLLDKDKLARDGLPSLASAGPRSMAVGQAVARRNRAEAPAATVELFEQRSDRPLLATSGPMSTDRVHQEVDAIMAKSGHLKVATPVDTSSPVRSSGCGPAGPTVAGGGTAMASAGGIARGGPGRTARGVGRHRPPGRKSPGKRPGCGAPGARPGHQPASADGTRAGVEHILRPTLRGGRDRARPGPAR
jgi:hypothetical protein